MILLQCHREKWIVKDRVIKRVVRRHYGVTMSSTGEQNRDWWLKLAEEFLLVTAAARVVKSDPVQKTTSNFL